MSPEQQKLANEAQMASPSYRLAALDQDFLLGESMRGVRFLMEYEKAEQALKAWGCLLYTSPSPRDLSTSRMPSSA